MGVGAVANRILDVALPASCAGCGREGDAICGSCRPALDARLEAPAGTLIGLPGDIPPPLLQLEWCAPYTGLVRRALRELKYGGEHRLALPLGRAVAARWRRVGAGGEVIVPVPVHPDRERQRGYDQAVLIAIAAGVELGMPIERVLERARATVAQYQLDRAARGSNVSGSFRISTRASTADLGHRWVVLIDDVVTTGATLSACASVLLAAGAIGVSAITVARER